MEIAAYRQPSVLRRKRALAGREAFGVKTEDALAAGARNVLHQRFQSELAAVRRLVHKAAAVQRSEEPPAKRIKASAPLPPAIKRTEAPKRIKASAPPPPAIKRTEAPKRMTQGEREMLAEDLAQLTSELPHHIVELLEKQIIGISGGEMEIDIHAVDDAALVELEEQISKFVRGRANPPPQQHQVDDKMMDEHEEDVDIVGGVSPLATAPAPLLLAQEEDEYVDICGDASPVASPSSGSSSDSDSDSASDSGSSDSDSDSDESVDSPAPAERAATPPITELVARAMESLERQRKEARCRAREKARQEVLETERTAMPSETIHPADLKSLHIDEHDTYSLLQLGLFLKVEDCQEQQHQNIEEDLEEGEIRS